MMPVAHGETPLIRGSGEYVGSPLYAVIPEHVIALSVLILVPLLVLGTRVAARRGWAPAIRGVEHHQALPPIQRLLFWLLVTAGLVHLALVFSHELSAFTFGYLVAAAAQLVIAFWLLTGRRWRRWAILALLASLLAYAVSTMAGSAPDQVGMATKLIELLALAIVITPLAGGRVRRFAASGLVVFMAFFVALSAWAGAFSTGEGGHHYGEYAEPGTLIPTGEDRDPTPHEVEEAEWIHAATVAAVAKYADPEIARADGYDVDGMYGSDFHAANDAYKNDGRIFDPERPENLIYAVTEAGPVLVGVMYEMENFGEAGPAIGGPLTVWHAHDHICIAPAPPFLVGLTSPYGLCPMGSVTLPITNEMIHVWTVPGAPEKIGHLEDEWLEDYLHRYELAAAGD